MKGETKLSAHIVKIASVSKNIRYFRAKSTITYIKWADKTAKTAHIRWFANANQNGIKCEQKNSCNNNKRCVCVCFIPWLKHHLIRCEMIPGESFVSFVYHGRFPWPKNPLQTQTYLPANRCQWEEEWERRKNYSQSFRQREGIAWNHEKQAR